MQNIQINPDLSSRIIEKDLFIFDRKNELLHSLNESGTFLWEMVKTGKSEQEMVDALIAEFDVDEPAARADINEFLALLRDRGLIV